MTVKHWMGVAASVAILSPLSSALAADGFYLNVGAGVNLLEDADNSITTVLGNGEIKSEYDIGFGLTGAGGYKFTNGIRVEGEIGYRRNAFDQLSITNDGGLGVALGVGSLNGLSVAAEDRCPLSASW